MRISKCESYNDASGVGVRFWKFAIRNPKFEIHAS
jgi:hypothetical protein